MLSSELKVVVAGDVSIDWYFWTRSSYSNNETINWKLYDGLSTSPQPGGAFLLTKMLSNNPEIPSDVKIIHQSWDKFYTKDPNQILHTNVKLDLFPSHEPDSKDKVYRVKNYFGFTTPTVEISYPKPPEIIDDDKNADIVIIHDAGNGFRFEKENWPKALMEEKRPIVIYNMYPPLFEGPLWKYVIKKHGQKLVLILNAEDLRKLGINISRSLSWEKTALEFLWEMNHNENLKAIKNLSNVIVRFKLEGVIHYNGQNRSVKPKLYFDTLSLEGGFWDNNKYGMMRGVSLVFIATLSSGIILELIKENSYCESLEECIRTSLSNSQEFLIRGHGFEEAKHPVFFDTLCKDLFENVKISEHIQCAFLPFNESNEGPDPEFWSILKEKTENNHDRVEPIKLEDIALKIVREGVSTLKEFPVARFGKLVTVDRAEIESFRSIMSIMEEYIKSKSASRPLSIAVFGHPGSGKSFGITEVAKCIDNDKVQPINFNISQFTSPRDLTNAFHKIRDVSLDEKIPLVFFDEFDCKFEGQFLGWLRYFLVPMQDGQFMDCGGMHPLGKSIFVFAGGIYKSFQEFCINMGINSTISPDSFRNNMVQNNLMTEKCPDFVSRLRGYVNILGPNKIPEKKDEAYVIRRAIQLRSLIEEKAPNIVENGIVHIDENILKALIRVPKYIHGVRSMQAIIEMSMLGGRDSWEKASLPPKDQLELHVDGTFSKLLSQR